MCHLCQLSHGTDCLLSLARAPSWIWLCPADGLLPPLPSAITAWLTTTPEHHRKLCIPCQQLTFGPCSRLVWMCSSHKDPGCLTRGDGGTLLKMHYCCVLPAASVTRNLPGSSTAFCSDIHRIHLQCLAQHMLLCSWPLHFSPPSKGQRRLIIKRWQTRILAAYQICLKPCKQQLWPWRQSKQNHILSHSQHEYLISWKDT